MEIVVLVQQFHIYNCLSNRFQYKKILYFDDEYMKINIYYTLSVEY